MNATVCHDTYDTKRLLEFTTLAELSSGREHCNINDGRTHYHAIKVENQRRETVWVKATSAARHGHVEFTTTGLQQSTWTADFSAAGQQITRDRAQTNVQPTASCHDQLTTDLEYSWDDPFSAAEPNIPLSIQVNL